MTSFFITKLLLHGSKDSLFLNKEPLLDRLNAGESLLGRENFLVTLAMFIIINAYVFFSGICIVVTGDFYKIFAKGLTLPLMIAEFIGFTVFAMYWLQYGTQIFFFEVMLIICGFFGFWIGILFFVAGMVSLCFKIAFLIFRFSVSWLLPSFSEKLLSFTNVDDEVELTPLMTTEPTESLSSPNDTNMNAVEESYTKVKAMLYAIKQFYPKLPF